MSRSIASRQSSGVLKTQTTWRSYDCIAASISCRNVSMVNSIGAGGKLAQVGRM